MMPHFTYILYQIISFHLDKYTEVEGFKYSQAGKRKEKKHLLGYQVYLQQRYQFAVIPRK